MYQYEENGQYFVSCQPLPLTAAESACIIAITNNPSLYNPKYERTYTRKDGTTVTPRQLNKKRQELILDKMAEVINPDTGKPYLLLAHNGIARVVHSYFYDMTNEEYAAAGIKNCQLVEYTFE